MEKTYTGWQEAGWKSKQTEYTESTRFLDENGNLLCPGWARHNVFEYDRYAVKHQMRRKEWDFYQLSDGRYMVQLSCANISLGGYVSAALIDLKAGKMITNAFHLFLGGKDKYILPPKGDVPNHVAYTINGADFDFTTRETSATIWFKDKNTECKFDLDIMKNQENLTTVLPFENFPDRYFMTTKQPCMPCEGFFKYKGTEYKFSKENTFCNLDWGRVCTPYNLVWYWGSGATYIKDKQGNKHMLGFEITWGIGDERNATETCIFYDGKVHKIGAVDVKTFPKPDKYMQPWEFISEDGRFNLTMTPFYDHHADTNALVLRMHSHQVHGLWNGTVILDDGTKIEIKDMYAFCEYVENRW